MRVLIIEDEIRLADALKHILSEEKYMVDMVHDGNDGLDYGLSGIYDVIILDVMLPGISGFHIAKSLRQKKNTDPHHYAHGKGRDRRQGSRAGQRRR